MFLSSSYAHALPDVRTSLPSASPVGCNAPLPVEMQVSSLPCEAGPEAVRMEPVSANPRWVCSPVQLDLREPGTVYRGERRGFVCVLV